jgi:hypothetical protein
MNSKNFKKNFYLINFRIEAENQQYHFNDLFLREGFLIPDALLAKADGYL